MYKLAVIVTTPPQSNLTATAIEFINAALRANIEIIGVFFYQDGVLNASNTINMPSDEFQASLKWQALKQTYNLPLHLCISAAEKRGLSDEIVTGEFDSAESSCINEAFTVSGLGELVELTTKADRVVQL